ncbi:MAG: hypothetical protein KDD70_14095 [Bdellovibrionales bacterium]|nr:hypothetical protein [Bdellovibrionales bacterium]
MSGPDSSPQVRREGDDVNPTAPDSAGSPAGSHAEGTATEKPTTDPTSPIHYSLALEKLGIARDLFTAGLDLIKRALARVDEAESALRTGFPRFLQEAANVDAADRIAQLSEELARRSGDGSAASAPLHSDPSHASTELGSASFGFPRVPLLSTSTQSGEISFANKSQAQIIEYLWQKTVKSGRISMDELVTAGAQELAEKLEMAPGSVNSLLSAMHKDGVLFKEEFGKYSLAPWTIAYIAENSEQSVDSAHFYREWIRRDEEKGVGGLLVPLPKEFPVKHWRTRGDAPDIIGFLADKSQKSGDGAVIVNSDQIIDQFNISRSNASIKLSGLSAKGLLLRIGTGAYALSAHTMNFLKHHVFGS